MKYILMLSLLIIAAPAHSAELLRVFDDLRPNATYVGNQRNPSSLYSMCSSYIGADCLTQSEVDNQLVIYTLIDAKDVKKGELNNEAYRRIINYMPYDSWNQVIVAYHDWTSIVPAARNPDAAKAAAIGHYAPWKIATDAIDNFGNISAINTFDSFTGLP